MTFLIDGTRLAEVAKRSEAIWAEAHSAEAGKPLLDAVYMVISF